MFQDLLQLMAPKLRQSQLLPDNGLALSNGIATLMVYMTTFLVQEIDLNASQT